MHSVSEKKSAIFICTIILDGYLIWLVAIQIRLDIHYRIGKFQLLECFIASVTEHQLIQTSAHQRADSVIGCSRVQTTNCWFTLIQCISCDDPQLNCAVYQHQQSTRIHKLKQQQLHFDAKWSDGQQRRALCYNSATPQAKVAYC